MNTATQKNNFIVYSINRTKALKRLQKDTEVFIQIVELIRQSNGKAYWDWGNYQLSKYADSKRVNSGGEVITDGHRTLFVSREVLLNAIYNGIVVMNHTVFYNNRLYVAKDGKYTGLNADITRALQSIPPITQFTELEPLIKTVKLQGVY